MKRGEIRWYTFARPDKKRPILIVTRDSVISYLGEITIAPLTSTVRNIPSDVFLSKHDGMLRDCAVNCDHLQTVSKSRIGTLITTLPRESMVRVGRAIRFALAI